MLQSFGTGVNFGKGANRSSRFGVLDVLVLRFWTTHSVLAEVLAVSQIVRRRRRGIDKTFVSKRARFGLDLKDLAAHQILAVCLIAELRITVLRCLWNSTWLHHV